MQELQRLQEESTGRKRSEKLEWMYATPATGSGQNKNDLEDYLLGKKRVDKLLTGDENEKVRGSPLLSFTCSFSRTSFGSTNNRSVHRTKTLSRCRMRILRGI